MNRTELHDDDGVLALRESGSCDGYAGNKAFWRDPVRVAWLAAGCVMLPIVTADLMTESVVYERYLADPVSINAAAAGAGAAERACMADRARMLLRETYPEWVHELGWGDMPGYVARLASRAQADCGVAGVSP